MRTMPALLVSAVLLGACGKSGGGQQAACEQAVHHAAAIQNQDPPSQPDIAAYMARVVDVTARVLVAHCVADPWKPDVIACLSTAKVKQELNACQAKLPPERMLALKQDMEAAAEKLGPMPAFKDESPGAAVP